MTAARRLVLAISAASALALPAGASSAATPTNFRVSTPVPLVWISSTPHATFFGVAPFEATVPHVGRATVEVSFSTCSPYPCAPTGLSHLAVRMTAPGGTLVLDGGSASHSEELNTGSWSVTEATGRFAQYTGSGTYTWTWSASPPLFGAATLTLAGHVGQT